MTALNIKDLSDTELVEFIRNLNKKNYICFENKSEGKRHEFSKKIIDVYNLYHQKNQECSDKFFNTCNQLRETYPEKEYLNRWLVLQTQNNEDSERFKEEAFNSLNTEEEKRDLDRYIHRGYANSR